MNPNWLVAAALAVIAVVIFGALRIRRADRVVAAAIFHTGPPRIETRPGSDTDALLDAYLAYYGADAFDRLLEAIDQHRKEGQS